MMKQPLIMSTLAAFLFLSAGVTFSADQEQIYGSQLMTQLERFEHRERLRNAKTNKERKRIRNEHHERMKERARALGKTLSDDPPKVKGYMDSGSGTGFGGSVGSGSGSGGGGGGGR